MTYHKRVSPHRDGRTMMRHYENGGNGKIEPSEVPIEVQQLCLSMNTEDIILHGILCDIFISELGGTALNVGTLHFRQYVRVRPTV